MPTLFNLQGRLFLFLFSVFKLSIGFVQRFLKGLRIMLVLLVTNLLFLLAIMTLIWAVSVKVKDASIVDIFWGPACALPAIFTYFRTDGAEPRALVITLLVCVWAIRLALYLGKRNLGHGEDHRYQTMRAEQSSDRAFARWSLPYVFWLQGFVAWFVSLPTQVGQLGGNGAITPLIVMGTIIFFIGFGFETVGDWQLQAFKAKSENKGKLMTGGLWSLTRHPNYFGDSLVWTGLTLVALASPYGIWTLLSPIVMTYFLINISGKPLTEKYMQKKYPDYADYQERVSGFIPLPPKKKASV